MADVTIYTTAFCPYCHRAKALLKKKGVTYDEIGVGFSAAKRREMTERAGGAHTVPQIFVGERHLGGCDELYALEAKGELDSILATTA